MMPLKNCAQQLNEIVWNSYMVTDKTMNKILLILYVIVMLIQVPSHAAENPKFLIRCDDIGMSHAANMAAVKMAESGIPFSASVMVATPWLQEAVDILQQFPHVAVGVHLTLTSEWQGMKWGPITGALAAPSLVDSNGYFFAMTGQFIRNNPSPSEVEVELRAQIERAMTSGLHIDYLDYHMGAPMASQPLRDVVEKLANEYNIGMAQYFGEIYVRYSNGKPSERIDSLVAAVQRLQPGMIRASIFHVALDTPEMQGLRDTNPNGAADVAASREADLDALLSEEFKQALDTAHVQLITYKDLIREVGIDNMRRPDRYNYKK